MNRDSTHRVHHVTFLSPGTLFSEETTNAIPCWDTALACLIAQEIVERNGARPYAFYFTTSITAPDVPDGMGGALRVERREIERSGLHFIDGTALTIEDVEWRADPSDHILISNMRCNGWIVCETRNGYRHARPFGVRDVIVNTKGEIVERGDTPERIAYRDRLAAR